MTSAAETNQLSAMLRFMARTHAQSAIEPSWAHDTAPALAHLLANQPDDHQLAASAMTMITTLC